MRKIGLYLVIFLGYGLTALCQRSIGGWKEVGVALDSLGRDTTLSDGDQLRVRAISRAYKGLLEKRVKDSVEQAKKMPRTDTVIQVKVVSGPAGLRRDTVRVIRFADIKALTDGGGRVPLPVWVFVAGLLLLMAGGVGWGLWFSRQRRGVRAPVAKAEVGRVAAVVVAQAPVVVEKPPVVVAAGHASLICELMMTAGPRKKFMNEENADKDLGEDVCGCVVRGNEARVWLLDGTSDQYCLRHPLTGREYFSSRLLAQHIGERLRDAFTLQGLHGNGLATLMEEVIEGVRTEWVQELRQLPEEERLVLRENIREKNCPECSSTVLSAMIGLDGKLAAYRTGDSKLLVFKSGEDSGSPLIPSGVSFSTKNPESNDRVFFRIVLGKGDELDILCNKPGFEVVTEEKVQTVIAFSDGIGAVTEDALKTGYFGDPSGVRRRIVTDAQGTADDKSIFIVRIREDS